MSKRIRRPAPAPKGPQTIIHKTAESTGFAPGATSFQGTGSFSHNSFRDKAVDSRA